METGDWGKYNTPQPSHPVLSGPASLDAIGANPAGVPGGFGTNPYTGFGAYPGTGYSIGVGGSGKASGQPGNVGGHATAGGASGLGYRDGGVVDRLIVPRGDDGVAALKFGEGVVDNETMPKLRAFLDGRQTGDAGPIQITIVTESGEKLFETTVNRLREASAQGQIVVHAEGIAPANQ